MKATIDYTTFYKGQEIEVLWSGSAYSKIRSSTGAYMQFRYAGSVTYAVEGYVPNGELTQVQRNECACVLPDQRCPACTNAAAVVADAVAPDGFPF